MDRVPDRKKIRRAYRLKKAAIYSRAVGSVVLQIALCLSAVILAMVLFYFAGFDVSLKHPAALPSALFFLFIMIAGIWTNYRCDRRLEQAGDEVARLPIPPEISEDLPAGQVLLRGSAPTPVPSDVLLRASTGSQDASEAQSLLRGATGTERSNLPEGEA